MLAQGDVLWPTLVSLVVLAVTLAAWVGGVRLARPRLFQRVDQPPAGPPKETPAPALTTYRLRQIPLSWDRNRVTASLQEALPAPATDAGAITVRSLAKDARGQTQTATFESLVHIRPSRSHQSSVSWPINVPDAAAPNGCLLLGVDSHFIGMTPLHASQDDDCNIDIVAVSGLAGHAFGSFKERSGSHMWLRDSLPHDLPNARVFIYGYECPLEKSQSFQTIGHIASTFRAHLKTLRLQRSKEQPARPLLLIGHSLGGLVLKKAIVMMAAGDEADQALVKSIHSIFLFGVPSQGMSIESLIPMAGDQPTRTLLDSLSPDSEVLRDISLQFPKAFPFKDSHVFSFFETLKSPTAIKVDGKWKMDGPRERLVSSTSATHGRPWEAEDRYHQAINRTHSELVKFGHADADYEAVLAQIHLMSSEACSVIANRLHPTESRHTPKDHADCARSLAFPDMRHKRKAIQRYEDTCTWVVGHGAYEAWLNSTTDVLWIKGNPGVGKSTVIEYALSHAELRDKNQHIHLHYFFNSRGSENAKSVYGLLRTLLHQLLQLAPTALDKLVDTYKENCRTFGSDVDTWKWTEQDLKPIFQEALVSLSTEKPIFIFVDGLDEGGEQAAISTSKLLNECALQSRHKNAFIKVCLACRHYPIIASQTKLEICVEEENHDDISRYVMQSIAHHDNPVVAPSLAQTLTESIVDRANGVFQWVALVLDQVLTEYRHGASNKDLEGVIKRMPSDLKDLYVQLLQSLPDKEKSQSMRLLHWLCFCRATIDIHEVHHALQLPGDERGCSAVDYEALLETPLEEELERRFRHLSRGLVMVTYFQQFGKVPHLSHGTVYDFVVGGGLLDLVDPDPSTVAGIAHSHIAQTCVHYLMNPRLKTRLQYVKKILKNSSGDFVGLEDLPLLWYARTCVGVHLKQASGHDRDQSNLPTLISWPSTQFMSVLDQLFSEVMEATTETQSKAVNDKQPKPNSPQPESEVRAIGDSFLHFVAHWNIWTAVEPALRVSSADLTRVNTSLEMPIHHAARKGHEKVVREMLRFQDLTSIVTVTDIDGGTLLHCATQYGWLDLVQSIIACDGVDPDLGGGLEDISPLQIAAANGHEDVVLTLLATGKVDVNRTLPAIVYTSPLADAVIFGRERAFKVLLESEHIDVNCVDGKGLSPLALAVKFRRPSFVRLLLQHPQVDVNLRDFELNSPLLWAVNQLQIEIVDLLLAAGADVNLPDVYGDTPLIEACAKNSPPILQRLLQNASLDLSATNKDQETALMVAAQTGFTSNLRTLLSTGTFDLHQTNRHGDSVYFYVASQSGIRAVMDVFQHEPFDVDRLRARNNRTPLHVACKYGRAEVVKFLLGMGFDVNAKDFFGRTPLHYAARYGRSRITRLLLRRGADAEAVDNTGFMPLYYAVTRADSPRTYEQVFDEYPLPASVIVESYFTRNSIIKVAATLIHAGAPARAKIDKGEYLLVAAVRSFAPSSTIQSLLNQCRAMPNSTEIIRAALTAAQDCQNPVALGLLLDPEQFRLSFAEDEKMAQFVALVRSADLLGAWDLALDHAHLSSREAGLEISTPLIRFLILCRPPCMWLFLDMVQAEWDAAPIAGKSILHLALGELPWSDLWPLPMVATFYDEVFDGIMSSLEHRGIDVNQKDDAGWTALHYVAYYGLVGQARTLQRHPKCDPTIMDQHGQTPLDIVELMISDWDQRPLQYGSPCWLTDEPAESDIAIAFAIFEEEAGEARPKVGQKRYLHGIQLTDIPEDESVENFDDDDDSDTQTDLAWEAAAKGSRPGPGRGDVFDKKRPPTEVIHSVGSQLEVGARPEQILHSLDHNWTFGGMGASSRTDIYKSAARYLREVPNLKRRTSTWDEDGRLLDGPRPPRPRETVLREVSYTPPGSDLGSGSDDESDSLDGEDEIASDSGGVYIEEL